MTRPLRVLQFSGSDETFQFVMPLARALKDEGFEVYAAARKSGLGPDMAADGVEFFDLPITRRLNVPAIIRGVHRTARLLRRLKIDILQAHTYAGGMIGRLAGQLAGTPAVIYMGHGWLYTPWTGPLKKRVIVLSERVFRRMTDRFFLISQEEYDVGLRDKILVPGRCTRTLGVGIDCRAMSRAATDGDARRLVRRSLGIHDDAWVCGFVGRIVAEKGLLELGKAFAELHMSNHRARLLIVGSTTQSERDQDCLTRLKNQLMSAGCLQAAVFAGRRSDVREVLSACDAFALPTYREGMPVALLEAMAMELPCVATDIPGCREEIVDGECGYIVPPMQVPPLTSRLMTLMRDPALSLRLGQAARRRVVELFSLEKVLATQVGAYRDIRDELICSGKLRD